MSANKMNEMIACEVRRVLEQTAFLFTCEQAEQPSFEGWADAGVFLTFSGTPSGYIHMWTTDALMEEAAMNMLGMDSADSLTKKNKLDVLKELLNISAGHILTNIYGKNVLFELGIPEKLEMGLLDGDIKDTRSVWINAEDEPLLVVFRTV
ncbi:MAG: chemotaxis protein CheX [Chitinispirillaceae bacterium]